MSINLRLPLPAHFRSGDFLRFHARDQQAIAEVVDGDSLRKGITWEGQPAVMQLRFGAAEVEAELAIDGQAQAAESRFAFIVRHMLGITQPVEAFEVAYCDHPLVGKMVQQQRGLRVPVCASPFEALIWAILGQQISLNVAISMRRKLIRQAAIRHSSGLYCYPSPATIARLTPETLRLAGISGSKTYAILTVSAQAQSGELPVDEWLAARTNTEEISRKLQAIKGIGPWTVNYTLLRGFGWLDGSLHGDVAVRKGIRRLTGQEQLTEAQARQWLLPFAPWRAILAAHLWAWSAHKN